MDETIQKLIQTIENESVEFNSRLDKNVFKIQSRLDPSSSVKYISILEDIGTSGVFYRALEIQKGCHILIENDKPGKTSFRLRRSNTESPDVIDGFISRLEIIGGNGFRKQSSWIYTKKDSISNYLFGISTYVDNAVITSPIIPSLILDKPAKISFKDLLILIVDFVDPDPKLKPIGLNEVGPEYSGVTTSLLYSQKLFSDLQIHVIMDGGEMVEILDVHKSVLAVRSPVFRTMLEHDMIEKKESTIKIEDFSVGVIKELLKFLYIGEVNLDNYGIELLKCADKYEITDLMELCQKYIAGHIPRFGWEAIFGLLELYENGLPLLKKDVHSYYRRYKKSLNKSPDFRSGIKAYPKQFVDMFLYINPVKP